jgi:hypothetical protein
VEYVGLGVLPDRVAIQVDENTGIVRCGDGATVSQLGFDLSGRPPTVGMSEDHSVFRGVS